MSYCVKYRKDFVRFVWFLDMPKTPDALRHYALSNERYYASVFSTKEEAEASIEAIRFNDAARLHTNKAALAAIRKRLTRINRKLSALGEELVTLFDRTYREVHVRADAIKTRKAKLECGRENVEYLLNERLRILREAEKRIARKYTVSPF